VPIDLSTDIGRVRLLINDTDQSREVFSDTEVQAFLDLEGGIVKLAAAQILDTIADDEALTSKVIRSQDLNTDGTKVAAILRARAASLRADARGASTALSPRGSFPDAPDDRPWR
jgi:hypothetical protein